jgi:hypothetical protein
MPATADITVNVRDLQPIKDIIAEAVGTLEHIAVHGEFESGCHRPPQDCAQDSLDRLRKMGVKT